MYPQSMFLAKLEKYQRISSENYHFYNREILQYIARTCLRNVLVLMSVSVLSFLCIRRLRELCVLYAVLAGLDVKLDVLCFVCIVHCL